MHVTVDVKNCEVWKTDALTEGHGTRYDFLSRKQVHDLTKKHECPLCGRHFGVNFRIEKVSGPLARYPFFVTVGTFCECIHMILGIKECVKAWKEMEMLMPA